MNDVSASLEQQSSGSWPREATVFPLDALTLEVHPSIHPIKAAHEDEIARNWDAEIEANPTFFNGKVIFFSDAGYRDGNLSAKGHVTPYSVLLWWRRQNPKPPAMHIFAYPVIVGSCGALVAIRMGDHTANPGQVYFAAGSLEPADVKDGRCDIEANMRREVLEETGVDLNSAASTSGLYAMRRGAVLTLLKLYRFEQTADEIVASIARHIEVADEDEIAEAIKITSADPAAHPYNAAMPPVLNWYFSDNSSVAGLR